MRKQPNKYRPTTPTHKIVGFTNAHQKQAMGEGWVLVYDAEASAFIVQKFDKSSRFEDDVAACRWLRYHAEGKPWRVRAWILVRAHRWQWDHTVKKEA